MTVATVRIRGVAQPVQAEVDTRADLVRIHGEAIAAQRLPLDLPDIGSVYAVALNTHSELAALGEAVHQPPYLAPPTGPILYIKPRNTHVASGIPVPLPADVAAVSIGASLGIVIGRDATRVNAASAADHIAGYTVINDISVPHDNLYRPAIAAQCRDGFCPIGPWVVQRDSVTDPQLLPVRVWINGDLRQSVATSQWVRPIDRLLTDVTRFMTLYAGDVLCVGVAAERPLATVGDHVRIEIDQIGALDNRLVAAADWWEEMAR